MFLFPSFGALQGDAIDSSAPAPLYAAIRFRRTNLCVQPRGVDLQRRNELLANQSRASYLLCIGGGLSKQLCW